MDNGEIKEMDILVASSVIFGPAIRMVQFRLDGLISNPLPEYYEEIIENTWTGITREISDGDIQLSVANT
jgi:hypothetical protein